MSEESQTTYMKPHSGRNGDTWNPEKRVSIDIEAREWTEVLAVGAYHTDGSYQSWTADEHDPIPAFVDWMLQAKHENHRFVAHNGGKYDFGFIIDELVDREAVDLEIITQNGSAIYVKVVLGSGDREYTLHLQDSIALMPRPLDDCARAFAEVQKGDFDFEELDTPEAMKAAGTWDEMLEYLKRDCVSLDSALDGFIRKTSELLPGDDTLSPGLTIASTTMDVYRQYFQREDIAHASEEAEEHIREAYYGGRTEVFKHSHDALYHGSLNHYDVNSLYPYVYGTMKHPVGKEMRIGDPDLEKLESMPLGGVVKISGEVPTETEYPVLPKREEINKSEKVIFPTGHIEGWYEIREIEYASSVGALENVEAEEAYLYPLGEPFERYTDTLYGMKQSIDGDANPGRYNIVKLLLNSFWGKFGMDRDQAQIIQSDDPPGDGIPFGQSLDQRTRARDMGLYEVPEESEASYIVPQVAVSVTAQARIELHKWFREARERGGEIWYCDTDSIATDVELPESDELGGMDLEVVADEAYFLSPKVYAEEHADVCPCCDGEATTKKGKGMKSDELATEITFSDYRAAVGERNPGRISVRWETVSSPRSMLQSDDDGMTVNEMDRSVQSLDEKRNHDVEANTSEPLNLDEIERERMKEEAGEARYEEQQERLRKAFEKNFYGDRPEEFDAEAQRDSELYADEAKKAIEDKRKMKGKDLKMFD